MESTPTPWIEWLKSHIGEIELTGGDATPFDEEVFAHTTYGPLHGKMEEGCAATACAALEESGMKSPHRADAISFLNYGMPSQLEPGCVVLFQWPNGGHHVAFCSSVVNGDLVNCLGGNQDHQVKVCTFSRKHIMAARWPTPA